MCQKVALRQTNQVLRRRLVGRRPVTHRKVASRCVKKEDKRARQIQARRGGRTNIVHLAQVHISRVNLVAEICNVHLRLLEVCGRGFKILRKQLRGFLESVLNHAVRPQPQTYSFRWRDGRAYVQSVGELEVRLERRVARVGAARALLLERAHGVQRALHVRDLLLEVRARLGVLVLPAAAARHTQTSTKKIITRQRMRHAPTASTRVRAAARGNLTICISVPAPRAAQ